MTRAGMPVREPRFPLGVRAIRLYFRILLLMTHLFILTERKWEYHFPNTRFLSLGEIERGFFSSFTWKGIIIRN